MKPITTLMWGGCSTPSPPPRPVSVNHHHHHSQSVATNVDNEEALFNDVVIRHPHQEIWGVHLKHPNMHVPTQIILRKILNHNQGDVRKARYHLKKILDWREKYQIQRLFYRNETCDRTTGVTAYPGKVMVWQEYRRRSALAQQYPYREQWFTDFMWYRVAALDIAMRHLLVDAEQPIRGGTLTDPYKLTVVDNLGGSPSGAGLLLPLRPFHRRTDFERAYGISTIILDEYYPQVLSQHFQVNLPPWIRAARRGIAIVLGRDFVEEDPSWRTRLPDSRDLDQLL